jgi:hypothetical protein
MLPSPSFTVGGKINCNTAIYKVEAVLAVINYFVALLVMVSVGIIKAKIRTNYNIIIIILIYIT